MSAARKVLFIEDNHDLVELVRAHLEGEGYEVTAATDGPAAIAAYDGGAWGVIILDWMLPGLSGVEVLRHVRERDRRTPVLMLTARGEEADKVLGLELGCDDYMTKPFSVRELTARIKVLRRRIERAEQIANGAEREQVIEHGPLRIDHGMRKVTIGGQVVLLTVKEYDLLYTLASRPGRTFSRRQLLDLVWHQDSDVYEHTVNSHINRLRGKIEADPNRPELILTVWGIGYRFSEEY